MIVLMLFVMPFLCFPMLLVYWDAYLHSELHIFPLLCHIMEWLVENNPIGHDINVNITTEDRNCQLTFKQCKFARLFVMAAKSISYLSSLSFISSIRLKKIIL